MNPTFSNIAIYVTVNLLLFSSWYVLLFRKKERLSFSDRLIGAFILGLTQIIATEMLLGVVFKQLYSLPLFLLNILISSGVLILAVSTTPTFHKGISNEFKDEAANFFNVIKGDSILFYIFTLFVISICWMIFLGYLFPSYTWDALWYHLPIVGYIMQSGAIEENSATSFINQFINIFPKNMELFFLWNVIFLKSDIIADLSQLLFTVIGVFAVYSIAIKLKIKEKYAIYSSLLFFFTPIIILQSTTNYIDVAVSVLFLVAINFLMCDDPENLPPPLQILLSGLTTGILLGSKGSGPLFVIVLTAVIMIQQFVRYFNPFNILSSKRESRLVKDGFIPYVIYFLIPIFFMGGYWYIKNWVLYNNPVYPMEISIFNITLFKGLYKGIIDPAPQVIENLSLLSGLFYVWLEKVKYYLYDSRLSGFGPLWFILFLPSAVFSLVYATRRKKYNFLFISAILIVTFLIHPRNWNTRYVIFIVGLGAVSFGFVLDYFNKRENILKVIALLLAGYTFLTANSPSITPKKIKEFIHLPAKERTIARHAPFNIDIQARQEYGYWIWINNNISKGDTLAYPFEPLFLSPLWNKGFTNKIIYIKSDNYNQWLKSLRENDVTYVLIRTNSMEDKWVEKEKKLLPNLWWLGKIKEKIKVVYGDENYKIMRLRQDERRGTRDEG